MWKQENHGVSERSGYFNKECFMKYICVLLSYRLPCF